MPFGNLTALYRGDDSYAGSFAALTQMVQQANAGISLMSSDNAAPLGQAVTFTAQMESDSGSPPSGTVTFLDGTSTLGTATLSSNGESSEATFTTSSLAFGAYAISAVYSGDAINAPSSYSIRQVMTGQSDQPLPLDSSMYVRTSDYQSLVGQNVTFTATVSGDYPAPTGTVTFLDGTTVLGTATLDANDNAAFTTSNLALGLDDILAVYSGDSNYSGSAATQMQSVVPADSSTSLASSANPSSPGQAVTFTATVASQVYNAPTPTGTVTFYDGSMALGSSTLSVVAGEDEATWTTASLALGGQEIAAIYSGDGTFVGSSASLLQTVNVILPSWQGPGFSWSQTPVANPNITTPSAQTNTEGDTVSLQIQASDPNGYPLSYDAVDLPPGLSIDSSTGLISGTVAYGAAEDFDGSYTPTVIVANNQGGSTQTSFSWTINQAQVAPVLSSPGDQSNLTGDNVNLQINATQVDNDPITYDASNLPDGLSIDPDTGIISCTVAGDAASATPYAVTVTATDDSTNVSSNVTFNWTIAASTAAPTWTAPGNQSNAVGDDVDVQLSASDANQDTLTYTATGLPPGLTLDPINATITGTLPNSATSSTPYNVTAMASNGINSSSQSFTWTVSPISLPNPGDQSNLDGDTVSLPMTATDANNDTLSYSAAGLPTGLSIDSGSGLISGAISDTADTNSPYAVTVTASDSAGNSDSQSFNWTVAPLALNPINDQENQEGTAVSLPVSAADNMGTPTYSASGLPPGVSINTTTGLISGTVGLGSFGSNPYQVTVTATDGSNTSSQSFVWTVTPRVALVNPGPQSNASGDNVSLQVSATSPGGTMSYSATGLPDGLSINSSTGIISGTIATDAASSTPYNVTVTANDGTSSSSQTFQWTVSVINLMSPGDQTNNDGDSLSLPLTTTYNGNGTLSYSATGLPPGLNISSTTGEITGTISGTADTDSPYAVTVTATDGTNTSTQTFNWTVNAVVLIAPIDDQGNADGDAVSLQVSAEDFLNNTLSYSATGLPPGLNINGTSGLISGTINAEADTNSPYAVTVTATDSAGLSASQSFNWNVAPVGLVNPGPQASVDDQSVSLQLQGSSGAAYTATGLPSGVSINSSTGLISGTLASNVDTNSPYVATATATLGSNGISQTFVWTVMPVGLIAPADQTNTEGDSVSLQLQGLSNGGTLSYSASGLPDGLSLDPTTGLITGTIAQGDAANGPYTVDVAVTNGTVSASQSFTWNVNPIVNLIAPDDQTNTEGGNVSLQVTATDALNNPLTYTADGLPSGLSISSSGLITGTIATGDFSGGPYAVTVTASDGTYSSSQTFTWNILQANPTTPTLSNPGTETNVASDSVNLQVNASDADGDALTYSATNLPDGLSIDPFAGTITGTVADDAVSNTPYSVTVTATDGNGISASQTFSWLVNAPVVVDPPSPISAVEGEDTGSITIATFTTADMNSQAGDFAANINYGDGSSDQGMVSGSNGSFTVTDDHTYLAAGIYTVTITISDTVTGFSTTDTTTATVTPAPLTVTGGFDLGALENQSPSLTLATFTSANPNLTASNFTATIAWGDGSGTLPATVIDLGNGVFGVSGSHAYALNGAYTATIDITGSDGSTANTTSTVTVGNLYAGIASNLTVASFTDSDPSLSASSFTATINWGDGTQSSGTVVGSNGVYQVQGTHTYAVDSIDQPDGVYLATVTVSDSSGNTLTSSSAVTVLRPPLTLDAGNVESIPLTSLSLTDVQVAAFTDPDVADSTSEFSATINWGDGSSSDGTIQQVSPGLFEVLGSHTYADPGEYTIVVSISQGWNAMMLAATEPEEADAGNAAPATIEKMKFTGPGGYILKQDSNGDACGPWQWTTNTVYPFAYVQGKNLEVTAVFKAAGKDAPKSVWIQGEAVGSGGFMAQIPQTEATLTNGEYTITVTAVGQRFPNKVWAYTPLTINWQISTKKGAAGDSAGETKNPVYVLYAAPVSTKYLYQTVVALGSEGASGANTPTAILNKMWENTFTTKAVKEASSDGTLDGKPLYYYNPWVKTNQSGKPTAQIPASLPGLLSTQNGQCTAWADLLYDALGAQGILNKLPGKPVAEELIQANLGVPSKTTPAAGQLGLIVAPWTFGAENNNGANKATYPWVNQVNTTYAKFPGIKMGKQYDWTGTPAVSYDGGGSALLAQNNTNPLATFANHVVVLINGQYYDPSYGKIYKNLNEMQKQSISGFYNIPELKDSNNMYIFKSGDTLYLYQQSQKANSK